MSERRASMRPPEMMNGSTKGRVSSCSSTLAMCTCGHVEEVQLAAPALERTSCLELEHPSDKSVLRVKHERVERALGARALGRGILGQGKLEERVDLDALAAAPGVLEDHPAGADVAGAREPRPDGRGNVQDTQIPVTQVPSPVRDALLGVEQAIEADERVSTPTSVHHLELDRKSTRLNSSHLVISYAVFCLKKK